MHYLPISQDEPNVGEKNHSSVIIAFMLLQTPLLFEEGFWILFCTLFTQFLLCEEILGKNTFSRQFAKISILRVRERISLEIGVTLHISGFELPFSQILKKSAISKIVDEKPKNASLPKSFG